MKKNNALRVSVDHGQNWIDLKIPVGCYNITRINEALQVLLGEVKKNFVQEKKQSYITLTGNINTSKCELEITTDTTIVDFDINNSIRSVLGFEAKIYIGGKQNESRNKINIICVHSIFYTVI